MILDREIVCCGKGEICHICNPAPPRFDPYTKAYVMSPTVDLHTLRKHYETNLQRRGILDKSLSQVVFTDNLGSCGDPACFYCDPNPREEYERLGNYILSRRAHRKAIWDTVQKYYESYEPTKDELERGDFLGVTSLNGKRYLVRKGNLELYEMSEYRKKAGF